MYVELIFKDQHTHINHEHGNNGTVLVPRQ